MSIDQTNVVDIIGTDNETRDVVLFITDHLMWSENLNEHLLLLQEKLNTYLSFVESGELLERYPNAKDRAVLIDVVCKYPPSQQAQGFCNQAAQIIEGAGMKLRFSHPH
ncbi:MAG: hypothetical protein LBI48_10210 [Burkholderiaceae bacterium]|jgi:hypothetical protein|nr:hypothetical protein [Burkholderiaceae bacterium]